MHEQREFVFSLDPVGALDETIARLLMGETDVPLAPKERQMLEALRWHKGAANPVKLAELAARLGVGDRDVKALAKMLVESHDIPVGARRDPPYGYFLCVTAEDYATARRPLHHEALSLLRRLKRLKPTHRLLELYGQLELAIEQESQ